MSDSQAPARFRDRQVVFVNGAQVQAVEFESANPVNFHQVISAPKDMQRVVIDAKLFLPPSPRKSEKLAVVIVVPGSLGVSESHLKHAEALTGLGAAALVIDPFGGRSISSTVANQVQYSFAASAYDVLAAVKAVQDLPQIDPRQIGAQGHSRGGSAVLNAAMRRFADAVLGGERGLHAVYAAYPWSGQQFLDPEVGRTRVRAVIGDRDGWCLPQQVQGHIHAIGLRGCKASFRLFADAAHSFDRDTAQELVPDASVSPGAPTAYIDDSGCFVHPLDGRPDPKLVDRDLMVYALKAGYGIKGATIGSKAGQAQAFREDMLRFWREVL